MLEKTSPWHHYKFQIVFQVIYQLILLKVYQDRMGLKSYWW